MHDPAGGRTVSSVRPSDDTRSHTLAAELTLGRAPDCALVGCDDTVSRHHARLELRDGRWFLVDLDSSNGTLVNGRRVRDAEVRAGDEIRLGAAGFTL
jgi:pSer/pThr/pTyr-binding forkhead associated (FHA) protein